MEKIDQCHALFTLEIRINLKLQQSNQPSSKAFTVVHFYYEYKIPVRS